MAGKHILGCFGGGGGGGGGGWWGKRGGGGGGGGEVLFSAIADAGMFGIDMALKENFLASSTQ